MTTWEGAQQLIGDHVVDKDNHRVGTVEDLAQVADAMEPTWLVIKTSLFGRIRLVPIDAVEVLDDVVHVPFGKEQVLSAPEPLVPVTVANSEAQRLRIHYSHAA
jgi:ribosomal 30S subunit maturation factor RimM